MWHLLWNQAVDRGETYTNWNNDATYYVVMKYMGKMSSAVTRRPKKKKMDLKTKTVPDRVRQGRFYSILLQ